MRIALLLFAFSLTAALPATGQSGSFGNDVLFVEDALLISEPNTTFREGSVYVYTRGADGWRSTGRLTAPDAQRADGFGSALAHSGETLFIGQRNGPLHVFQRDGNSWNAVGTVEGDGTAGMDPGCGQYGYCGTDFGITLAAEGDWLLVGAPGAPLSNRRGRSQTQPELTPGVVYAYQRGANGEWTQTAELRPSDGHDGDRFGATIHLSGGRALIGAPLWKDGEIEDVGRVYDFGLAKGTWAELGTLSIDNEPGAHFGSSFSVANNTLLVGAPGQDDDRGAAFRYLRDNESGAWRRAGGISLETAESGDQFGSGITQAGGDVWIGAPTRRENETGATYRFSEEADQPTRLQLEDTVERDLFGDAIVSYAGVVAVGSPGMHHQSGSVHVYERTSDGWSDGQMLVGPPDALGAIVGEARECVDGQIGPFDCEDVELLSFVPNSILRAPENSRGVRTNDNWGWTDPETNREYALVGRNDGTSFIDITDPANPVLIGDLPKPWGTPPSQLWRDIKTYKDHAFIVADGAGDHGMQVFDLTRLRDVQSPPELFEPDLHYTGIASSHNVIINEETGFAYTVDRQTCAGGLYMMNIQDPLNPEFVGCSKDGERGTHDSQCVVYQGPDTRYRGRELCLNSNGRVFAITDVTDKDSPVQLSSASSPDAAYIHQGWLTPDHRYFYQDDEADVIRGNVPTTRTLIWDLSDVEDPILVNEFMGSMPASAHNLYLKDGFAYQANYRFGMHVLDISDPENPVEAGFFDTSPYQDGAGFSGAWSTYPFFESGTVIVTSLQEGLFVLRRKRDAF